LLPRAYGTIKPENNSIDEKRREIDKGVSSTGLKAVKGMGLGTTARRPIWSICGKWSKQASN
jgi:hypothetical protein